MSKPLRVAAAVEGPTDAIVLQAILETLLSDTEFEFQRLQPEESRAFDTTTFGQTGAGWVGVYRWSRQSASEGGGSVSGSSAFACHDILIVHVDADVAAKTYASGSIKDAAPNDLPCEKPCPPPRITTDALRIVVLNWLGERNTPRGLVLCTPSKNIEAWVVAAVWPDNHMVQQDDWECRPNPGGQLAALPTERRFSKRSEDYQDRQKEISREWPNVSAALTEARRFETEFLDARSEVHLYGLLAD